MDERVLCPLNSNHVMLRKNLQRHIIKCMMDYPDHVACTYNAQHLFQTKEEMLEHIPNCPSRHIVHFNYHGSSSAPNINNTAKLNKNQLNQVTKLKKDEMNKVTQFNSSEEDWNK